MKLLFSLLKWMVIASVLPLSAYAQSIPEAEDFIRQKQFGELTLSPSGQFLAFPDYRNSGNEVVIYDLESKTILNRIDLERRQVDWVKWATDDRLLAGLTLTMRGRIKGEKKKKDQYDEKGFVIPQKVSIRRVMALNKDGSNRLFLFDKAKQSIKRYVGLSKVENILAKDPDHILMPAFDRSYDLWKVNINTGELEKIEKGTSKTYGWKTNSSGEPVVRYESLSDGNKIRISVRAPGQKKWLLVSVLRRKDFKNFEPIGPTSDPSTYYVSARPDGHDKTSVFEYSLDNKTFLDKVSSESNVDVHETILDESGYYAGSSYIEDRIDYKFIDDVNSGHFKGIDAFFNYENNIDIKQISENGKVWLLYVYGPKEPGSYYYYQTETKTVDFLITENNQIQESDLSGVEVITYKARDGLEISGYLTSFPASAISSAPLIVFPHGGPQSRDYIKFNPFVQFLASHGYQVFQPNFRGSRGFGLKFEEAGYKEWGGAMQQDITDGVQHLIKFQRADKEKICIVGASYGGFAALTGATAAPDLYKCSVAINAVSDLSAILEYDSNRFEDDEILFNFVKKSIGDPKSDSKQLEMRSPINNAANVNIPILLIHGDQDRVVPVNQSRALHEKLNEAGKNSEYIELSGANHNLLYEGSDLDRNQEYSEPFRDVLVATLDFLDEHLKN